MPTNVTSFRQLKVSKYTSRGSILTLRNYLYSQFSSNHRPLRGLCLYQDVWCRLKAIRPRNPSIPSLFRMPVSIFRLILGSRRCPFPGQPHRCDGHWNSIHFTVAVAIGCSKTWWCMGDTHTHMEDVMHAVVDIRYHFYFWSLSMSPSARSSTDLHGVFR